MTVGDSKINAGIYIYNELTEMSYQMTMMYYQKGIKKDYFNQKVDGKAFDEYLSDYALTATKEYAAVVDKFNELGLTLSDEDIKSINDSISSTWDSQGEFYESEGISKESVKLALKGSKMREELFDHYYAEGGEEAVSDDEMVKYLDDNYLRYKSISFAKLKHQLILHHQPPILLQTQQTLQMRKPRQKEMSSLKRLRAFRLTILTAL